MNSEDIRKLENRGQRAGRVRSAVRGTSERPRLSISISNRHIGAQLIDDSSSKTVLSASTVGSSTSGSMSAKSELIAERLAAGAKKGGIKKIVFDRGYKRYHGRVKAFADKLREGGLEF